MRSKTCFALLCAGVFMLGSGRLAAYGQAAAKPAKTETAPAKPAAVPQLDQEGLRQALVRDPAKRHPLLLNLWATWCEPCRDEFPDLVNLVNEFGPHGLDFLAVSFDFAEDANTEIPKFLQKVKAQSLPVYWLNVPDNDPVIKMLDSDQGGVIPETFLYDGDGKLVFKHRGRFDLKELRAAIESQMGGK